MPDNKKIYKVRGHDYFSNTLISYFIAESKEQLIAELEEIHEGSVIIDEVVEVTVEHIVYQLNCLIDNED